MNKKIKFFVFFVAIIFLFYRSSFFSTKKNLHQFDQYTQQLKKEFSDFEGMFPVIVVTNQEKLDLVSQLAKKFLEANNDLCKGVYILEYPEQNSITLSEEMPSNLWVIKNFDGSLYALYPFSKLPSYYFIKSNQIAAGPYEKRIDLLDAMVAEKKNNKD